MKEIAMAGSGMSQVASVVPRLRGRFSGRYPGRLAGVVAAAMAVVLAGAGVAQSAGSNEPFVIANYPVQAEADNAVAAKKKAMEDGQNAAFRSLLKRIVPVTAYNSLDRLKGVAAAGLVDGMSVRSERNSSTEYIASLDFSFSPDAVRRVLREQGVPFIDSQAPPTVVVPVYRAQPGAAPGNGIGQWGQIWKELDLSNTITPVRIDAIKPGIHSDTLKMIEAGDSGAERIVAGEYGIDRVVFLIGEYDGAANKLRVVMSGKDAVGSFRIARVFPVPDRDIGYAMEYAAVVALGIIEGRWKAVKARDLGGVAALSGPGVPVYLQVEYGSPGEWYDIQQKLQSINGVEDFQTTSVSARAAGVSLRFPGGGTNLANILARGGMSMRDDGTGQWVLRRSF